MLDTLLASPLVIGAIHVITSVVLIATALIVSSVVHMNKGAKVNAAFVVIAAGIIIVAVVPGNRALADFGIVDLTKWNEALTLLGATLVLIGVFAWRRIVRRMVS